MKLKITNKEIKDRAVESLKGNWIMAALATFVAYVIVCIPVFAIDLPTKTSWGTFLSILLLPLSWGYTVMFLCMKREGKVNFDHLFEGFKDYFPKLFTMFLKFLFCYIGMFLFVVPGIILAYGFGIVENLMKDNPELRYVEALMESWRLMKGHKMQLFLLDLSMIGWLLLAILTLGLGSLFLTPYVQTAHAHFYEQLMHERSKNLDDYVDEAI